jgi:glutathione S-transferase
MITVHHLNFSRSSRVLWLLEELGLDYQLVRYQRDAAFRAPPSLEAIHPLGKAPVIQDGDLVLAESSTILAYVNERHGGGRFSPPVGSDAAAIHDEWLQYVEGSAAFPVMMTLIGGMTGGLPEGLQTFVGPSVAKTMAYIASGATPGPYLMGEAFTLADIQMSYLLVMAERVGLLEAYPTIAAYLKRLEARPAFAKAVEMGGPMVPAKG